MRSLVSIVVFILLSTNGRAALLSTEPSTNSLEKVTLAKSAQVQVEDATLSLTPLGAGLRAKKVVFVNVRVYVGQLFVSDLAKFKTQGDDLLKSIKDQKAIAIQLHFLRSVDAESVQKSFREALSANSVNLDDASIKQFLDYVAKGGEAKEGKTLTILGTFSKDGLEMVSYENTAGTVSKISGGPGFVTNIFSIWLGKPADDGIAQLKKSLLKL